MNAIEFHKVRKNFTNATYNAVDYVDLIINEGEFITILGSSGCGKTTLMKMINRLYEPDEGEIILFSENIKDMDVIKLRRRIGYVIQQVGVFPHMTISENIAKEFCQKIKEMRKLIDEANVIVIGAGAGLSTSAGFVYDGENFRRYFSDFEDEYGFSDMYEGAFYPFKSDEEH